ncbi:MAG: radical SAM domain-containing protein [Solirubrobacterales bacterium]|nr:radical SAM domain-containing protein [Solirubrobacterales bacterium]
MTLGNLRIRLRSIEQRSRPEPPELKTALERRWREIPEAIRTPNQFLGRRVTGCEGTHGVFPRCNLACTPCYHSKDSNRVRIDAEHTVREVDSQMQLANEIRGPGQAAQLIGGEVTLLGPEAHARSLQTMINQGRKPMSMTHGDFNYEYLEKLALDPATGKPRFSHLSFAGHFDMTMHGRKGIRKVKKESDLNPYRKNFCEMFKTLEIEHGVTSFLAHNMTVTPGNIDQIPGVIRACRSMGFRLFSFQPAAFVGSEARWKEKYGEMKDDLIWERIQEGAGGQLHPGAIQWGDPRCNRTAYGGFTGERYWTLFDEKDQRDVRMRDLFLSSVGGIDFTVSRRLLVAKLLRAALREPRALAAAVPFLLRLSARMGGLVRILRSRPVAVTFVMHSFMDAAVVRPAWEAMEKGQVSEDSEVRAAQERLQGCMYGMAHPEEGRMVPACVQHSVLDPEENVALARLLPLAGPASDA